MRPYGDSRTSARWAALNIQAKRDIFDIVLDRVIVYPKENPHNRWAPPHKIKVLWR